ncbi:hypothetical protein dsx2_1388 [Desulfovibrio sp. X2]|uniref:hypothetical protein n=1 Tax=Desulfovibrio sp. X2 TaxID=941449 RepID=UPI0003589F40|nr:hypothetical protein [Desulfovibrio sp. X2]EPR44760.1 hypothetical protein dsx2_1388 [Desulfovibrio sp. X2]
MKGILTVLTIIVYLTLIAGDFLQRPDTLFIPGSIFLSGAIMLGIPWAYRRFMHATPLGILASVGAALVLLAVIAGLLLASTPQSMHLYANLSLFGLNGVFCLLAAVILHQERQA